MEEVVREMMSRAEDVWREYHGSRNVSAWELEERLDKEKGVEGEDGKFYVNIGFDPIFCNALVKASWWESSSRWVLLKMKYDGKEWSIHADCQGEESELERICFELVEEANQ